VPEVEFGGETFQTSDAIGLMSLMRFAVVAKRGTDANDLAGLVAMYELLEQCFDVEEFERFQQVALRTKAKGDELMGVVGKVIEAISGRPTSRPSDSSDGPEQTQGNSGLDSSSPVVREMVRLEGQGRPDRAIYLLDHLPA
jgi:hypothetical protein